MAVEQAKLTQAGRVALAKSFAGTNPAYVWSRATYFKIGVSGYQVVGSEKVPLTPDETLTDIKSVGLNTFWYRKALTAGDISVTSYSAIFQARLETTEANGVVASEADTATGLAGPKHSDTLTVSAVFSPPQFFEIGIFDAQDKMIVYGTFPAETKTALKVLTHVLSVNF